MWNTVLFDLDGTLADSARGITGGVQYALQKGWGRERSLDALRVYIGPPLRNCFMRYEGLSAEEADHAASLYQEYYSVRGMHELRLYDGIADVLRQLRAEHFKIALTSAKPAEYCRGILEEQGIAGYFDAIVGSSMDGTRVEKSVLIRETLMELGVDPASGEAVMVGDRYLDIEGAKSCGIASIGVSYGYGSREELIEARPDCIVDTPYELRNVLIGQMLDAERRAGVLRGTSMRTADGRKIDVRKKGCGLPSDGPVALRIWRCIYPLIVEYALVNGVALVVMVWAGVISGLFSGTGGADLYDAVEDNVLLLTGIADAAAIPVMYLMYRSDEKKRRIYAPEGRIPRKLALSAEQIAAICVLSIGAAMVLNIIVNLLPLNDAAYEEVEAALTGPGIVEQLIVVGLVGPIAEELTFRGVIFRRLRDYVGAYWAAILSGVMFGVYHGNLTQGIFATIFGILLALIYEHYGNLKASIAAHMANNIFSCLSSLVPDQYQSVLAGFIVACIAGAILIAPQVFRKKSRVNAV